MTNLEFLTGRLVAYDLKLIGLKDKCLGLKFKLNFSTLWSFLCLSKFYFIPSFAIGFRNFGSNFSFKIDGECDWIESIDLSAETSLLFLLNNALPLIVLILLTEVFSPTNTNPVLRLAVYWVKFVYYGTIPEILLTTFKSRIEWRFVSEGSMLYARCLLAVVRGWSRLKIAFYFIFWNICAWSVPSILKSSVTNIVKMIQN